MGFLRRRRRTQSSRLAPLTLGRYLELLYILGIVDGQQDVDLSLVTVPRLARFIDVALIDPPASFATEGALEEMAGVVWVALLEQLRWMVPEAVERVLYVIEQPTAIYLPRPKKGEEDDEEGEGFEYGVLRHDAAAFSALASLPLGVALYYLRANVAIRYADAEMDKLRVYLADQKRARA